MIHGSGYVAPASSQFPWWVVKKIGEPLLTESDWNYASLPNGKYGAFLDGASTLSRDTTVLLWGGAGSCKMATDAVSSHNSEVKASLQPVCKQGDLLSFEMKWLQSFAIGNTNMQMGLESRDVTNILQGRFRWTSTLGKWQYEDNSLAYQDFPANIGGALPVTKPTVNSNAGNITGWARCIIDPFNKLYVGFQAGGLNGQIETRDMRSMALPLSANGSSGGNPIYLIFALVFNGANTAETGYTTDWCVSRIPASVNPF